MKKRKHPYIHILPRILIGILAFGTLLTLLSVPVVSRSILQVSELADAATPMPTATPERPAAAFPESSMTPSPSQAPTQGPTEAPSDIVTISIYSTLRLGDDNASVVTLQNRLTDLGYLDSDMPGSQYNDSIASAVVLFQRACDMEQTGVADTATQYSLFAEDAQTYRIKRMDTGTDVLRLQQRLEELGYYEYRANGYFGPNTEQAVMMFQAINDLNVSGELDYGAWTLLYSEEALPAPVLATPTPRPTARRTAAARTSSTGTSGSGDSSASGGGSSGSSSSSDQAASQNTPKPATNPPSSGKKTYSSVVAAAQDQLGKPYVWSAEGPDSFDCSGLVYYCLKQSGHSVSRHTAKSYSQTGSWTLITSMSDLRAGDLVFFKSDSSSSVNHCGICISSSTMIHASSSKGQVAKSRLNQDYWERNFVCGRRP